MKFEPTPYAYETKSASARAIPVRGWALRNDKVDRAGLSFHTRHLRKKHHGVSRSVALAVLAGALVAMAFVNFLAH